MGGTQAGAFYLLAPRVVLAYPRAGYKQTEVEARASLDEQHRIAREIGSPVVLLVLLDRVKSQDSGSRRVWAEEADRELLGGLALVGKSPLARAMGSFFLGLRRPRIRTRMFASTDDALEWAAQVLGPGQGEPA